MLVCIYESICSFRREFLMLLAVVYVDGSRICIGKRIK